MNKIEKVNVEMYQCSDGRKFEDEEFAIDKEIENLLGKELPFLNLFHNDVLKYISEHKNDIFAILNKMTVTNSEGEEIPIVDKDYIRD